MGARIKSECLSNLRGIETKEGFGFRVSGFEVSDERDLARVENAKHKTRNPKLTIQC